MAKKYEEIGIVTNSNEKHGPGTSKQTYTAINSPLYTPATNGDKIVYSTDINWKDIILSKDNTSEPIQDTATLLDFIATRFNAMNTDITDLLSRVEALEGAESQPSVRSISFKHNPYKTAQTLLFIGDTIDLPKPEIEVIYSDGTTETISGSDTGISWEVSQVKAKYTYIVSGDTPCPAVNFHNYNKFNYESASDFGDNGNPLDEYNGSYFWGILDDQYHGERIDESGTSYQYHCTEVTSSINDMFGSIVYNTANIQLTRKYNTDSTSRYNLTDYSYFVSTEIKATYHDKSTTITDDVYFVPSMPVKIKISDNEVYTIPLKAAACAKYPNEEHKGTTLSEHYDETDLQNIPNLGKYFTANTSNPVPANGNDGKQHVVVGFSYNGTRTLTEISSSYTFNNDYIKLPDPIYTNSYGYYAYMDSGIYNNDGHEYMFEPVWKNRLLFRATAGATITPKSLVLVDNNETVDLTSYTATLPNHEFKGWYKDNQDNLITSIQLTENVILYAKFEEESAQTYYWYVGTSGTKPSSLPTNDSELASGNNEGWRKFTQTSGQIYNASENHITFNSSAYYWLIIPNNINIKVETNDGNNYLLSFEPDGQYAPDSNTIPGYTIYSSKDQGNEFSGIIKY